MKWAYQTFACVLVCLILCSCAPETDFRIPKETAESMESEYEDKNGVFVVINKNSKKYHLYADCVYAKNILPENCLEITVPDENYLREHGYSNCLKCAKGD